MLPEIKIRAIVKKLTNSFSFNPYIFLLKRCLSQLQCILLLEYSDKVSLVSSESLIKMDVFRQNEIHNPNHCRIKLLLLF